jgi:hypothetical protein
MPVLIAGALALAISALPPAVQAPFAATILAQTVARLAICPALADLIQNNVRVESLQQAGDGFGVFYSASCAGDGITAPPAGFLVFQRAGFSWQNLGGEDISYYDAGCMTPRVAGQKLCCLVSNGDERTYTAVFGLVLAANVKRIEIAFADGEVIRSSIVDHRFAIARPGVMEAGEMRALAADGRVLDAFRLDLSAGAQVRGTTGCRA